MPKGIAIDGETDEIRGSQIGIFHLHHLFKSFHITSSYLSLIQHLSESVSTYLN